MYLERNGNQAKNTLSKRITGGEPFTQQDAEAWNAAAKKKQQDTPPR
jgi:hypothetical protein